MENNKLKINKNFSISEKLAQLVIQTAFIEAKEKNTPVSIAVVDFAGHLVAFKRMDGAYFASVDAAIGKARSCAGFQTSTGEFSKLAESQPWLGDLPGMVPLGGTAPLYMDDHFIGAISISGDNEESEQNLANIAAAKFPELTEHFLLDDAPLGVEHIGITVPDMDSAEEFFHQAFNAVTLYSLIDKNDPPASGKDINALNGIDTSSAMSEVRMLRLGNGANIELFSLTQYGRKEAVGINDMGITHIGVYCDNIALATERFVAAGGTLLKGPNPLSGCEAGYGNHFHFGKTPWGMLIEFICFPSPLKYNKTTKLKRWNPIL